MYSLLAHVRVEGVAASLDLKVQLKPLRHAVRKLLKASVKLDKEKSSAEEHLRHVIKDWRHAHPHHPHPNGYHCGSPWKRLNKWIKSVFGATTRDGHELDGSNLPHKLIKAVKRVQAVNKKLSGFESGFISKKGIAEREWYKHLAVAPGRWLG